MSSSQETNLSPPQVNPQSNPGTFLCISCYQGTLQAVRGSLACPTCSASYLVHDQVPILLPTPEQHAAVSSPESQAFSLPKIQAVYDRVYEHDGLMGTDLDLAYDRSTKQVLLSSAAPLPGKRLLDLGTGIGNLWQYVPPGVEGYAFDISATGVRKALERFPNLTISVSIAEYIPYADSFFDVVVAADTIEHTFSPSRSLEEIYRVLRPGGVLVASFPIPDSLRKWGKNQFVGQLPDLRLFARLIRVLVKRTLLFGRPDFQPIDRDYSTKEWQHLLEKAGFQVEQVIEWPEKPKLPIVTLVRAVRGYA